MDSNNYQVIVNEMLRQRGQGFLEQKTGLIGPNFYFEVMLHDDSKYKIRTDPKIRIVRGSTNGYGGVVYRKTSGTRGEAQRDEWLAMEKEEEFTPFHDMIRGFIPIMGERGEALYTFLKGSEGHDFEGFSSWVGSGPTDLETAIKKYRCRGFEYSSGGSNLKFKSDHDPSKNTGMISIDISLGYEDFDIVGMGRAARVMGQLPYVNGVKKVPEEVI